MPSLTGPSSLTSLKDGLLTRCTFWPVSSRVLILPVWRRDIGSGLGDYKYIPSFIGSQLEFHVVVGTGALRLGEMAFSSAQRVLHVEFLY